VGDRDLAALDRVILIDHVHDQEQVDRAGLRVELRFHLAVHPEGALGRGQDRLLERVDQHALVDVLVAAHLLEDHVQLGFHGYPCSLFSASAAVSSAARRIAGSGSRCFWLARCPGLLCGAPRSAARPKPLLPFMTASQSGTSLACSMSSSGRRYGAPSHSISTSLPSTPRRIPLKLRRSPVARCSGIASWILASLPAKCAKCAAVRSGRSMPGELTSRLNACGIGSSTSS